MGMGCIKGRNKWVWAFAWVCLWAPMGCNNGNSSDDGDVGGSDDAEAGLDGGATEPGDSDSGRDTGVATDSAETVFPGDEWLTATPESLGLDSPILEEAAVVADEGGSHCLMVTRHGHLAGEWYFDGWDRTTSQNVFSVTKSVTSTLVGIAVDQGLVDLDDPASIYIDEWQGTASEAVTIRQLLSNTSGRYWSIGTDYLQMAFIAEDKTAFAVGLEQQHDPGTYWEYNNAAIQTLQRVLREAVQEPVYQFARGRLLGPIGVAGDMSTDAAGNTVTFSDLVASCSDLMRFGYLVLRGGRWADEVIVSEGWLAEATSPSSTLNDAYGFLWWLNRQGHWVNASASDEERDEGDGQILPGLSENIVMARGLQNQLVVIDPDHDLVMTRIGGTSDLVDAFLNGELLSDPDFVEDLTRLVIGAVIDG